MPDPQTLGYRLRMARADSKLTQHTSRRGRGATTDTANTLSSAWNNGVHGGRSRCATTACQQPLYRPFG